MSQIGRSLDINSILLDLKEQLRPALDLIGILDTKLRGENLERVLLLSHALINLDSNIESYIIDIMELADKDDKI